MIIPTIETRRLRLRPFVASDAEQYRESIFENAAVLRYLPQSDRSPLERTAASLANNQAQWERHGLGMWAVTRRSDGQFIGRCGLNYLTDTLERRPYASQSSDEVEVAYAFAQPYWGEGFASEAARASVRFWFENHSQDQLIGLTMPANLASQRVLEKSGLVYLREAHYFGLDLKYYALARADYVVDDGLYCVVV